MAKTYTCTICQKPAEYDGPLPALYPFCSIRCRRVDLARWFSGQYAFESPASPEEFDEAGGDRGDEVDERGV